MKKSVSFVYNIFLQASLWNQKKGIFLKLCREFFSVIFKRLEEQKIIKNSLVRKT